MWPYNHVLVQKLLNVKIVLTKNVQMLNPLNRAFISMCQTGVWFKTSLKLLQCTRPKTHTQHVGKAAMFSSPFNAWSIL